MNYKSISESSEYIFWAFYIFIFNGCSFKRYCMHMHLKKINICWFKISFEELLIKHAFRFGLDPT